MSNYSATMRWVVDESGERVVVDQADPVIHISPELWDRALDETRKRIPGDLSIDGDRVSFGVDGHGLGRLTYRLVEMRQDGFGGRWYVCERTEEL